MSTFTRTPTPQAFVVEDRPGVGRHWKWYDEDGTDQFAWEYYDRSGHSYEKVPKVIVFHNLFSWLLRISPQTHGLRAAPTEDLELGEPPFKEEA